MRNVDLAYIAGIVDGEGCLSLGSRAKNGTCVIFEICQKKPEVLYFIRNVLGRGNIRHIKNKTGGIYRLEFFSKDTRYILPYIRPYCIVKRRQIEVILDYFNIIDTIQKNTKERNDKVDNCIAVIRHLNKRGIESNVA